MRPPGSRACWWCRRSRCRRRPRARRCRRRCRWPRRCALYERSMELVEAAPGLGAVGATISGAGPTVLFWTHWEQTGALVDRLRAEAPDCEVRRVTFAPGGADVSEL